MGKHDSAKPGVRGRPRLPAELKINRAVRVHFRADELADILSQVEAGGLSAWIRMACLQRLRRDRPGDRLGLMADR